MSVWMLIALFVICMFATRCVLHSTNDIFKNLTAQELTSPWRKTKFGWLDSTRWDRPEPVAEERRIELLHPLLFSALMILVTIGFLIWSTEEQQWAAVTRSDRE